MEKEKKKVKILLYGYNGVNNTGSEAKLLTTIKDLKEILGDRIEELACLTQDVELERRYVKDSAVKIIRVGAITVFVNVRLFLKKYDILILNEGSTFIDHFSSAFIWMFCAQALTAKFRGLKVVAYSNDCGHLKPINQRLLKLTLNKLDLIMLRNPDAVRRMKEYGVENEIHCTADGAYEYPPPSKVYINNFLKSLDLDPERRPIIGLAPKEFFWWPVTPKLWGPREDMYRYPFYHSWKKEGKESSKRYIEQSAKYADWCVETFDADIAIIAMENMDAPPAEKIYKMMKHKDKARLILSKKYVVDDIVSVLSALKFQVTTRYHTTVLASPFGIPMISVSSDTRCEAVFEELEMMDFYLDYVAHPAPAPRVKDLDERLVEKTKLLVEQEDKLRRRISEAHPKFLERCLKSRVLFKEWFDQTF